MSFDTNKFYKLNQKILGKFKETKVTQYDETHSFRGELYKPHNTIEYIFEFANLKSTEGVTEATQDEYDQEVNDLMLIQDEKIEFNTVYTDRVLNIKTNLKDFLGKNVILYDKNEKVIDGFIEKYYLIDNKLNYLQINGDNYYLTDLTSNQQNKTFFNNLIFIGTKHDEIQICLRKLGYSFEPVSTGTQVSKAKLFGMYHGCEYKLYEFNGEITDTEITGDNLDTIVRYLIFSNIVVFIQS